MLSIINHMNSLIESDLLSPLLPLTGEGVTCFFSRVQLVINVVISLFNSMIFSSFSISLFSSQFILSSFALVSSLLDPSSIKSMCACFFLFFLPSVTFQCICRCPYNCPSQQSMIACTSLLILGGNFSLIAYARLFSLFLAPLPHRSQPKVTLLEFIEEKFSFSMIDGLLE